MGSGNFVNAAHSVGINSFHFEWCPKYRYSVLADPAINPALLASLRQTAAVYGMQILVMEAAADHIHLFVNLPPTISVSEAFQYFKGRSSRQLFQLFPQLRRTYWGGHLWSRGKFYRSVSDVSGQTIYRYIKEHRHKELYRSIGAARAEMVQLSLLSFTEAGNRTL
jgi:putative transposase